MDLPRLTACSLALLLAGAPAPTPAGPPPLIQRCQAPDGEVIYTDVACAALGAKPMPMRSELLDRISREHARIEDAGQAQHVSALATLGHAPPRRPAADGCARSSTQLAMDLEGAVASGDVNRVAESYHWAGLSSQQARHILERLDRLLDHPQVQARFYDVTIGGALQLASSSAGGSGGGIGVLQLTYAQDGFVEAVDLDVQRYRGCYFVAF